MRNTTRQAKPQRDAGLAGARRLAWLLDRSVPLPGGFRIGLDGLLGLIPGVGDAIGGGLSTWIVYQAWREGAPRIILARMLLNVGLDTLLGAIPLLGDLFDFFWKSNLRNLELLDAYRRAPQPTYRRSLWSTLLIVGGLLAGLFLLVFLVALIAAWAWRLLFPEAG